MSTDAQKETVETSYLPDELIEKIVEYIVETENAKNNERRSLSLRIRPPPNQIILANLCLLNKQWNRVAVTRLYARPWLNDSNYGLFVRTVYPGNTVEPTRRDLAEFVKELDLRLLVQRCSKSVIAGLLGRTKANLEVFRAAPSVFGVNCLVALSNCAKLHVLDLSAVKSPVNYFDFARTLEKLPQLTSLDTPRIRGAHDGPGYYPAVMSTEVPWPATLSSLRLSRMYPSNDLASIVQRPPPNPGLPNTITTLVIQNGRFRRPVLARVLENAGPQLRDLTLTNLISVGTFNEVLCYAGNLERLCISINLINSYFPICGNQSDHFQRLIHHPLRRLEIATCSGTVDVRADRSHFSILSLAHRLDSGVLTNLRRVDVWESAAPRFRFPEWDTKWMHATLVILANKDGGGYEDAGMYTLDDRDWDGMVTLD